MLVVRSDDHLAHHCLELDGTRIIPSWEAPDRAQHVDSAMDAAGFSDIIDPGPFDATVASELHDADYVEFLKGAFGRWKDEGNEASAAMAFGWPTRGFRPRRPEGLEPQLGYYSFAADCSIGEHTWKAVAASASTAETAAIRVSEGAAAAFARCRPPGHHAMKGQFGGYCYLNNAAIAAQRLRNDGAATVGVLDVDYHHGNGTQDIFYDRSDVAFCSIHADPSVEFPYFLGYADEVGSGAGDGANLNVPLPHGTEAPAWFDALETSLTWMESREPDVLVVSLGVDTFVEDPISHFRLGTHDFPTLGARLASFGRPTLFVMEGGYATAQLGDNVVSVLQGFLNN